MDVTQTRILLLLPQSPHDPASGAARSMRTICEFLAASGMSVRALATTATEERDPSDPLQHLGHFSVAPTTPTRAADLPVLSFNHNRIAYSLHHTAGTPLDSEARCANQFNRLYEDLLQTFRPHILFTYGGQANEIARRRRAREMGCAVVFGLRNFGYLSPQAFEHVDAILTGSHFLSDRYRQLVGIESTALPLPLDPDEVLAPRHERIFITYINPSIEKGVMFVARLAEELSLRRPDIPMLVVESRGTAGQLVSAGLLGGFDLRRHGNLMFSPSVAKPADIYALSRVVIAPSVWEEPAGRVAAEAVLNGIPPVVSDRGGLAEMCGSGGFVLPLPPDLTLDTRTPVPRSAVKQWLDLLIQLADDEPFYTSASQRAAEAGKVFNRDHVAPLYVDFFKRREPDTFSR